MNNDVRLNSPFTNTQVSVTSDSYVSNALKSDTVEGVCFQTEVIDRRGGSSLLYVHTAIAIFIRSLNLEILNNGSAYRTYEASTTKLAQEVNDIYLDKVNNNELKYDENKVKELWEYTDEKARNLVQVPGKLANEINDLVKEKEHASKERKVAINISIANLAKMLFLDKLTEGIAKLEKNFIFSSFEKKS